MHVYLEANQVNMTELFCGMVCPRLGVVLFIGTWSVDDETWQMITNWFHDGGFVHCTIHMTSFILFHTSDYCIDIQCFEN